MRISGGCRSRGEGGSYGILTLCQVLVLGVYAYYGCVLTNIFDVRPFQNTSTFNDDDEKKKNALRLMVVVFEGCVMIMIIVLVSFGTAFIVKRVAASGWRRPVTIISRDVWTTLLLTLTACLCCHGLLLLQLQLLKRSRTSTSSRRLPPFSFLWQWIGMCGGLFLGEQLCPIVLTGGIATGKSTVARSFASLLLRDEKNHHHRRWWWSFFHKQQRQWGLVDADVIAHQILLPPALLSSSLSLDNASSSSSTTTAKTLLLIAPKDSVYQSIVDAFAPHASSFLLRPAPRSKDHHHHHHTDKLMLIDRDALGRLVFGHDDHDPDPDAHGMRKRLNALTHPRIVHVMLKQIVWCSWIRRCTITCADIPLFFESSSHHNTTGSSGNNHNHNVSVMMLAQRRLRNSLFALVLVVACSSADTQFQRLKLRNPDWSDAHCWERIHAQWPMSKKIQLADIVIWNDNDKCNNAANGNHNDNLDQQVQSVHEEILDRLYGCRGGMMLYQMALLFGLFLSLWDVFLSKSR